MEPTLNQLFIDKCKLHKTFVDYLKIAYKPTLHTLEKTPDQSDCDFEIAKEYNELVFYISLIRNIFTALKHSLKEFLEHNEEITLRTENDWRTFCTTNKNISKYNPEFKKYLDEIINFPTFMWLKSISEIPNNTEILYLCEIDSLQLQSEINKFNPEFKKYAGLILKHSNQYIDFNLNDPT